MQIVLLSVSGIPRPQPRPIVTRGRAISIANPKTKAWADQILRAAHAAKQEATPTGALAVELLFRMPTKDAKRWGKPHLSVPDADNLAKLALDAMQKGGLFPNDSAVWSLSASKVWERPEHAGMTAGVQWGEAVKPPPPLSSPEHPRWIDQAGQGAGDGVQG